MRESGVEPSAYLKLTDNWVEVTLHYVVGAGERRYVQGELLCEILAYLEEHPGITIAPTTIEMVDLSSGSEARKEE